MTLRWPRFGVRTLLLVILLLCLWLASIARRADDQRRAVLAVNGLRGQIAYDYEQPKGALGSYAHPTNPPGPAWFRNFIGLDYLARITSVSLVNEAVNEDRAFCEASEKLAQLPALRSFGLDCSGLKPSSLARLGRLRGLKYLYLSGLDCRADDLKFLAELSQLETLHLIGSRIDGNVVAHLKKLNHLKSLQLSGDWCDEHEVASIPALSSLAVLAIYTPTLTISELLPLAKLDRLKTFSLSMPQLNDEGLAAVGRMTHVEGLELDAGQPYPAGGTGDTDKITSAGLSQLSAMKNLTSITLWRIPIDRAGIASLKHLPRLEFLRLEPSQGVPVDALRELKQFRSLKNLEAGMDRAMEQELYAALPGLFIYNP